MKKRLAKGLNLDSDSYGDEEIGTDTIDGGNAVYITGTARGRKNRRVQVVPGTGESGHHPPCPEGFDPAKWANMTLEEKCAHLGIDMKEWLKMNRE